MAGKNRNTFLKRQREMERMRRAKEKMERRHGRNNREECLVGVAPGGEDGVETPAPQSAMASPVPETAGGRDERVQHTE